MIRRAAEWLSEDKHSTYGLAVTRMILGFIVASQLVVNWFDRSYTWGEGARWTEPVASSKSWPSFLGLYEQLGPVGFDVAYLLTIVFATLMMMGYRTRASMVLTLVLWMSLYVANPFVGSGGDAVLRMVLLYLCFTDSGQRWSVDARLRRRRGEIRPLVPSWLSATVHNLAMILIIHQVVMVYVASAFWKLQSPVWKDGSAVYYPLQTDAYSPWHDWLQPIYANGVVISGATYLAIVVQLVLPRPADLPPDPVRGADPDHRDAPGHRHLHGDLVLLARHDRGRHDSGQRCLVGACRSMGPGQLVPAQTG
ncbi:HTTM domain-containing protein [Aeromicrobium sp. UC242_57]|uniref:HTTM domain-containing protein n=1 Tax=Aeromicrobium sp. UC242_57 TaxID=3374624 RepID=UPI00378C9FBC